jgi:hypothetical protein
MPNGKPGDNPITDLMVHGMHPFPPDIEDKIRELAKRAPQELAKLGWEPFEWGEGKKLDEARTKLDALLKQYS